LYSNDHCCPPCLVAIIKLKVERRCFRVEHKQTVRRYAKWMAWAVVPPRAICFSVQRYVGLCGVSGALQNRYKSGKGLIGAAT
jgi:hypothetical protein